MGKTYGHAVSVTSQIPFCATPIRLDPYNQCQFSCAYCFAATREGFGRQQSFKIGSAEALRARLTRIKNGQVQSVLDEFIEERIPFQIGGMSDPFSPIEKKKEATLEFLKLLAEFNYPYIVSTKSDLIASQKYLEVIKSSDAYIRFSTTVVSEEYRPQIDKGCTPIDDIFEAVNRLDELGIPTSLRFQPIIPDFEHTAPELIKKALNAGVKHISAEYLKVPLEADKKFGVALKKLMGGSPISNYITRGAKQQGREYVLPFDYRYNQLTLLAALVRKAGMTFGFADNDMMLLSDGESCCNASNLYLKKANFFRANITGIAKLKKKDELIYFDELFSKWQPKHYVDSYLNSKSRLPVKCIGEPDWLSHLRKMWIGQNGLYKPDFFYGIERTDNIDQNGLPVYVKTVD